MSNRVILGNFAGNATLRVSRPDFDVLNPNLTNEQLSFDSSWLNSLIIHECGHEVTLPFVRQLGVAGAGTNGLLFHEYVFQQPLDYIPTAFAWLKDGNNYLPVPTYLFKDRIRMYPQNIYMQWNPVTRQNISVTDPAPYTFVIFANKYDEPNASAASTNRVLIGNHPTEGSGIFVSKPNENVLTVSGKNFMLSSKFTPFQIEAAGSATGLLVLNGQTGSNQGWMQRYVINLPTARPDRPPLFYHKRSYAVNGNGTQESLATWYTWNSDTQITVWFGDWSMNRSPKDQVIHWWLPRGNFSPEEGNSSNSQNRILLTSNGLKVSKKNVDVLYASSSDLLFNSEYSMLNIAEKTLIWPQNNNMTLNNNTNGIPLVFYIGTFTFASNYAVPVASIGMISDKPLRDYNRRDIRFVITRLAYTLDKNTIQHLWYSTNNLPVLYYNFMEFSSY